MSAAQTAMADQIKAATAETALIFAAAVASEGGKARHVTTPGFVVQQVAELSRRVADRTCRPCAHLDSPAPTFALAWEPENLWCRGCVSTRLRAITERERNTCDRCRRESETLRSCATYAGAILLLYGVCEPCHRTLVAEESGGSRRHRRAKDRRRKR